MFRTFALLALLALLLVPTATAAQWPGAAEDSPAVEATADSGVESASSVAGTGLSRPPASQRTAGAGGFDTDVAASATPQRSHVWSAPASPGLFSTTGTLPIAAAFLSYRATAPPAGP